MQPRDAYTQQKSLTQGEKEGPAAWQSTEEGACGSVILFFILCAKCAGNEILLPISLLHSVLRLVLLLFTQHSCACTHLPTLTVPLLLSLEPRGGCWHRLLEGRCAGSFPFKGMSALSYRALQGDVSSSSCSASTWHRNAALITWLPGNSFNNTTFPMLIFLLSLKHHALWSQWATMEDFFCCSLDT